MYVLAIDQGTTGTTASLIDDQGQALESQNVEFKTYYPQPGWVEQDPLTILDSIEQAVNKLFTASKYQKSDIKAIGITNQRETTVIWEKNNGQPIHRAIVWQCKRTQDYCQQLSKKGYKHFARERTGLPIDSYFSASKIKWLLDNVPEARRKALNGELLFGNIDTWVLWNLTGRSRHLTEYTNASRTLLYNIYKKEWDQDLLKLFNIPESLLPQVCNSAYNFGQTRGLSYLPDGIPIAGIAGDQQAALYGQGCIDTGMTKNTYGTGCFMLMNTGERKIESSQGLITTLCCDKDGKPAYALEGAIFIAGAVIQWLRDELQVLNTAAESEKYATSVADNGGVYFVPALAGLGTPYWDMGAKGAILGLTRGTSRAHVIRAALESLAYQAAIVMAVMKADSRLNINAMKVDGGACENNFLMQFQADIMRIPVIRPQNIQTTALGSALLAGVATGLWDGYEITQLLATDQEFKPQMAQDQANELLQGYKISVERILTNG
jgi:glycerol kinase